MLFVRVLYWPRVGWQRLRLAYFDAQDQWRRDRERADTRARRYRIERRG